MVNASKFAFDDAEALVDKLRCADCNLVLVVNPVFVVDLNGGIDYVFGTLCIDIVEDQTEHVTLFFHERHSHTVIASGGRLDGGTVNMDGFADIVEILGGIYEDASYRGVDDAVQTSADALALILGFRTGPLELRHDVVSLSIEFNSQTHIVILGKRKELYLNGERTSVEGIVVEHPVNGIVDIKMQAFHHLLGDGRALQRQHFVVDVRGTVSSEFTDLLLDASLSALHVLNHECGITGIDRCSAKNL